jgi:hypothetical protein
MTEPVASSVARAIDERFLNPEAPDDNNLDSSKEPTQPAPLAGRVSVLLVRPDPRGFDGHPVEARFTPPPRPKKQPRADVPIDQPLPPAFRTLHYG